MLGFFVGEHFMEENSLAYEMARLIDKFNAQRNAKWDARLEIVEEAILKHNEIFIEIAEKLLPDVIAKLKENEPKIPPSKPGQATLENIKHAILYSPSTNEKIPILGDMTGRTASLVKRYLNSLDE